MSDISLVWFKDKLWATVLKHPISSRISGNHGLTLYQVINKTVSQESILVTDTSEIDSISVVGAIIDVGSKDETLVFFAPDPRIEHPSIPEDNEDLFVFHKDGGATKVVIKFSDISEISWTYGSMASGILDTVWITYNNGKESIPVERSHNIHSQLSKMINRWLRYKKS